MYFSRMTDLDATDIRLLAALQRQGRAALAELAEAAGLSASQAGRRLSRLEESGTIQSYAALLDPQAIGLGVLAIAQVSLERHAEPIVEAFQKLVRDTPEILDAYSVTGEADFVLRIVAPDLAGFADFVSARLLRQEGIRSVRSSIVLHRIKQTTALPLPIL